MALSDRPTQVIQWQIAFPSGLMESIGALAILSALVEECLHHIYWRLAGISAKNGPFITGDIKAKRLGEDILHLAQNGSLDPAVKADLELLIAEADTILERRNQLVHWRLHTPGNALKRFLDGETARNFEAKRPSYRRKGKESVPFTLSEVDALCGDCAWLQVRLEAHTMDIATLINARKNCEDAAYPSFPDIFLPAPWLDKLAQPASAP